MRNSKARKFSLYTASNLRQAYFAMCVRLLAPWRVYARICDNQAADLLHQLAAFPGPFLKMV